MSDDEDRIISEAAAWHAASTDDGMDWDGFTAWLEADARHSCAYNELVLVDSLIDEHLPMLLPAGNWGAVGGTVAEHGETAKRGHRGRWVGAAVAASLAAVFLLPPFLSQPTVYRTTDRTQHIVLADGSTVTLAPHSRLSVSGGSEDRLALTGGAWFDIRHDPSRTLAITAGQVEIRDIGTRFDVQAEDKVVRVGVAEGVVTVASQALSQPIRLEHGRKLLFDGKEGTALVTPAADPAIGAWRSGRLSYEDTPLPLVLDDLSRYAGIRVAMPDSLQSRRFSGSLIISNGEAAIRDLAQVMGLPLDRTGKSYRHGERSR
jgi:transmembrane sensor